VYLAFGKRTLDLTLAVALVVLASPLWAAITVVLAVTGRGRVLFTQVRPGLDGQPFTILKFRTMTDARDEHGQLLSDELRLTPLGRLLRRTSLDELPQLLNVLRGDLSLVGPRPLLTEYLPLYTREQARRHGVRPGVSGLAQVEGRNAISWEDRFALDVHYVDNVSMKLDIEILRRTLRRVLSGEGVTSESAATVERFRGSAAPLSHRALEGASR